MLNLPFDFRSLVPIALLGGMFSGYASPNVKAMLLNVNTPDIRGRWMSHVTHVQKSCHTYNWVISHIWVSHVIHRKSHVTHMIESCHIFEWATLLLSTWTPPTPALSRWGISFMSRSHVTHVGVMSHMSMTCLTPMNDSRSSLSHSCDLRHTYECDTVLLNIKTPDTRSMYNFSKVNSRLYVYKTIVLVQYKTTKELSFKNVRQHYGTLLALALKAITLTKCTIQNHNAVRVKIAPWCFRHGALAVISHHGALLALVISDSLPWRDHHGALTSSSET